jgi:polyhydroxyalkanoate synthesis regulator phasin
MGCGCSNFSNAEGGSVEVNKAKQIGTDILDTVKEGAYDIFDVVKGTGKFVYDEAKEGYEDIKEQGEKLDEKNRLIKSIPNSYLVFGAVGLLLYSMIK